MKFDWIQEQAELEYSNACPAAETTSAAPYSSTTAASCLFIFTYVSNAATVLVRSPHCRYPGWVLGERYWTTGLESPVATTAHAWSGWTVGMWRHSEWITARFTGFCLFARREFSAASHGNGSRCLLQRSWRLRCSGLLMVKV